MQTCTGVKQVPASSALLTVLGYVIATAQIVRTGSRS